MEAARQPIVACKVAVVPEDPAFGPWACFALLCFAVLCLLTLDQALAQPH